MASQVKGVSIDISADTSKFQKALRQLDAPIKNINSELKDLNYALKLDPKNTQLLAQKQEVLGRKIAESKDKLETLKQTQKEFGDYSSLTDEQKAKYNQLSAEIVKTENSIKDMNKELQKTSGIDVEKLKNGLKKVGEVALDVTKKLGQISAVVGGALASVVSLGVKSYAELEQNLGGVETLFGKSADKVIENAKNAYKTAGVSANEYMAGVTSFSASLLQSLGGDTAKAADVADMAFRDMSDNANKFGTDMSSIQNAYQGFAKQNYTMLDNLKLGYGGTKTEMERLLSDAEKLSGKKYDIKNLNDVYEAIHVVQEELGVTGTTAEEAEKTISGSAASMKAAFDNFINGSGSPEALAEAFSNFAINIGTTFANLLPSIVSGLTTIFSNIVPLLDDMLWELLPHLLEQISNLLNSMFSFITNNQQRIAETVTMVLNQAIMFITQNLPLIIDAGIKILLALVDGIVGAIPILAEALPELITTIINVLIENIPAVLDAAIQLLMALINAIPVIIQELVNNLPSIIDTIITTLIDNIPMLLQGAIQLFMAIVKAIPTIVLELAKVTPTMVVSVVKTLWNNRGQILEAGKKLLLNIKDGIVNNMKELMNKIKEIPGKLKDWLIEGITKVKDAGKELISGLWQGVEDKWNALKDKVKKFGEGVVGKFKKVFGISSPSKVFKKEIGQWLGYGIEEGFTDTMKEVSTNMAKSIPVDSLIADVNGAMSSLSHGINTSINPNINPNITLDQNYLLMAKAMKDALSDMEVALDDREVGKFITKTITDEIYGGVQ